MLDISAYIEPRRAEYYERLLRVSTDGDWARWLDFFLNAVAEQATDAVRRAKRLQALREEYRLRVTSARASSLLPQLVDALFATQALTIGRAQKILGVTPRAATQTVERLVMSGILTEHRYGRRWFFLASEIIAVANGIDDPAPSA